MLRVEKGKPFEKMGRKATDPRNGQDGCATEVRRIDQNDSEQPFPMDAFDASSTRVHAVYRSRCRCRIRIAQ